MADAKTLKSRLASGEFDARLKEISAIKLLKIRKKEMRL